MPPFLLLAELRRNKRENIGFPPQIRSILSSTSNSPRYSSDSVGQRDYIYFSSLETPVSRQCIVASVQVIKEKKVCL